MGEVLTWAARTLTLAGGLLLGWLLPLPPLARLGALAVALLIAAFAGYLALLLRRRPGAPCGCFGSGTVSATAVARAALIAPFALLAAVLGPAGPDLVTAASAVLVAAMLWLLPQISALSSARPPTAA